MKFNNLNKGRIAAFVITTVVAVSSSFGAIVFAANGMDAVPKNVVMAENGAQNTPQESKLAQAVIDSQGTIEYRKTTHTITENDKFSDEKSFIAETWLDPKTLENREDCKIISGENDFTDFQSTYVKNNGSEAITIQRDQNGNAVSGTVTKLSQKAADKNFLVIKYNSFAASKAIASLPEWKNEGIEKASDGKELKKLSQTYMNSNPDNVQVKTDLVCYIDTATGFPVREELYQDVDGTMQLIWYDTYEYKYVNNDDKLFDTNGVELKELSIYKQDVDSQK